MTLGQRWFSILIVAVAFALRVYALDYKPAHFDEGVNGVFVNGMLANGFYDYDPANFHGPLHFYAMFLGQQLFGKSVAVARMPTVIVGTATVLLMLAFRRFMPWRVAWIAALGAALSPGMIFYSRYAIHEAWMPFFTLLAIYGAFGISRREGRTGDLWCVGLGLAGMMLTKETYIIHWVAAGLTIATMRFLDWLAPLDTSSARSRAVDLFTGGATVENDAPAPVQRFGLRKIAKVSAICAGIVIAFYSGFGLNWPGIEDIFTTFGHMLTKGTGGEVGHNKEFLYWMKLMSWYEWPALVGLIAAPVLALRRSPLIAAALLLGGAGLAVSGWYARRDEAPGFFTPDYLAPYWNLDTLTSFGLWIVACGLPLFFAAPARSRELRWLCIYGLGVLTGYSLVPYKTPWCVINLVWPFFFSLGQLAENLVNATDRRLVYLVGAMLTWTPLAEVRRLVFKNPTADSNRYAYVQTTFDIHLLLDPIRQLVSENPLHRTMRGLVLTEPFPLSWLLSDIPNISYLDQDAAVEVHDADFILIPQHREAEFDEKLAGIYFKEPCYMRNGGPDGRLYLNVERFFTVFPDRAPELRPGLPQKLPETRTEAPEK